MKTNAGEAYFPSRAFVVVQPVEKLTYWTGLKALVYCQLCLSCSMFFSLSNLNSDRYNAPNSPTIPSVVLFTRAYAVWGSRKRMYWFLLCTCIVRARAVFPLPPQELTGTRFFFQVALAPTMYTLNLYLRGVSFPGLFSLIFACSPAMLCTN